MERNYLSELQINLRLLFSKEHIAAEVSRLAQEINADYAGGELLVVVVLKGALFFAADLLRGIQVPLRLEFIKLSSYVGTQSSGTVQLQRDLETDVAGRDILVVEDIVDTGLTLSYLVQLLHARGAGSVRVCALVDKKAGRRAQIKVDYTGLQCEGGFLVGYGLDVNERLRELTAIYEVIDIP